MAIEQYKKEIGPVEPVGDIGPENDLIMSVRSEYCDRINLRLRYDPEHNDGKEFECTVHIQAPLVDVEYEFNFPIELVRHIVSKGLPTVQVPTRELTLEEVETIMSNNSVGRLKTGE